MEHVTIYCSVFPVFSGVHFWHYSVDVSLCSQKDFQISTDSAGKLQDLAVSRLEAHNTLPGSVIFVHSNDCLVT